MDVGHKTINVFADVDGLIWISLCESEEIHMGHRVPVSVCVSAHAHAHVQVQVHRITLSPNGRQGHMTG